MNYGDFMSFFYDATGINLRLYKEQQMKRRIETFMGETIGEVNYYLFMKELSKNPKLLSKLESRITINVTEFFRNKDIWDSMKLDVIPNLIEDNKKINIWSAGSSSGEEAYSLAMMIDSSFPDVNFSIIGTDIDEEILKKAKKGCFQKQELANIPDNYKIKYFEQIEEDLYCVKSNLKSKVTFSKHNLLEDEFPTGLDLILCRNVVIYFKEESKSILYKRFSESLKPGGFLITGNTESVHNYKECGFERHGIFIFRKQ